MPVPLFIRIRGRVKGPYAPDQLRRMSQSGQFSRLYEVSEDGSQWVRAANYPGLLDDDGPATTANDSQEPLDEPNSGATIPLAPSEQEWYYLVGGEPRPIDFKQLRLAVRTGEIGENDLIWRAGMTDWLTVRQTPELADVCEARRRVSRERHVPPRESMPANSQVSGLAVASLVLSIVWVWGIGSLLAVIFGSVAMYQIRNSNGRLTGWGLAVAGLTLGIVLLALQLCYLIWTVYLGVAIAAAEQGAIQLP